ncbi:Uncharacterized protein dnm_032000 [Desulfonema magnum]|uniref:Uncharacterized protein n=1 Tax=Desulfonema magnum TaxID=45655 RepID=A0A975BKM2_9BACT|nr:Uncharacterized protein dnm_032000 [Desulfonema magnum]
MPSWQKKWPVPLFIQKNQPLSHFMPSCLRGKKMAGSAFYT